MEGPIVVFKHGVALHKKALRAKKDSYEKGISAGLQFDAAQKLVEENHPDAEGMDFPEFCSKHSDITYRAVQHRIGQAKGEEDEDLDEELEDALAAHCKEVDEGRVAFHAEKAAEAARLKAEKLAKAQAEAELRRNPSCVEPAPSRTHEVMAANAQARRDELAVIRVSNGHKEPQVRRYGEEKTLAEKLTSLIKVMDAAQLQLTVEFIEREWPHLHA